MTMTFETKAEQLDYEICWLMRNVQDRQYVEYLKTVQSRLFRYPEMTQQLRQAMLQNFEVYRDQAKDHGIDVPDFYTFVYPNMGMPKVIDSLAHLEDPVQAAKKPQTFSSGVSYSLSGETGTEKTAGVEQANSSEADDTAVPKETPKETPKDTSETPRTSADMFSALIKQEELPEEDSYDALNNFTPPPAPPKNSVMRETYNNGDFRSYGRPNRAAAVEPPKDKQGQMDAEFTVGIVVLSIVGAFFVLAAAAMFVSNFMGETAKCLLLYAACAGVFCLSELVVLKRIPKLSAVLSALSISSAMVITLVECFSVQMFPIYVAIFIVLTVSLATTYMAWKKQSNLFYAIGFVGIYISLYMMYSTVHQFVFLAILAIFLVTSRLNLLLHEDDICFRINDLVMNLVLCFMAREAFAADGFSFVQLIYFVLLLASFFFAAGYVTVLEIILTASFIQGLIYYMPSELTLPLIMGVSLAGIYACFNLPMIRDKIHEAYVYVALVADFFCLLGLIDEVGQGNYEILAICFIFALATLVLLIVDPKYNMIFQGKFLPVSVLVTYFALILEVETPLAKSAMMMAIALGSVVIGFRYNQKSIRIYGLILSMLTCGKIVIVDFFGATTLTKTVLYLAIGILALVIAGVYIYLEKKESTKEIED